MKFSKNFKFEKGKIYSIEQGLNCYFGEFIDEKNGIYTFTEYVLDEKTNFGDIISNNQTIQFTTKDLIGANID